MTDDRSVLRCDATVSHICKVAYEENVDSTGTEMRSSNLWTNMELIFRSSGAS
jgi:hypothetical protein